jgi:hypothetical protein
MTATTRVDFTLFVDKKGYRLLPGREPKLRPGQHWLDVKAEDIQPARIVARGGKLKRTPLNNYPALFAKFADITMPEQLLEFISEYGPLTRGGVVPDLLDQAKRMRRHLKGPPGEANINVSNLTANLYTDRIKGTVTLRIVPPTLLDALWLQLAQSFRDGAEWRKCRHCGESFLAGGQSGRRIIAEFCCDEHRKRFNSLARSRA